MSYHIADANKMVSDTPRSDAHNWHDGDYDDPIHAFYDFARQLERELNAANDRIKRLEDGDAALTYSIGLDLQKENEALKARIQRLEEAGDALKAAGYFGGFGDAVNKWNKAKEDKP